MLGALLFGLFALLVWVIGGLLAIAVFAFWIWMLIHAITNKGLTDVEKLIWVLVVIFLHALGALIYFFVGKPKGD
jgi:hypothetical protein